MPWNKYGINRIIPPVIWQPEPQVPVSLREMKGVILDIGAGGRQIAPEVLGIDFIIFPNTAVVADIHHLPFAGDTIDGIFCTGVLEHVEDPHRSLEEMSKILRVGGQIHIEVPFIQPFHQDPVDYWRWTLDGLRLFVRKHGIAEVRSGAHLGPTSAMNALIIAYSQSWVRNKYIRKGIDLVLSWVLWPLKYIDAVVPCPAPGMPSAVFLFGRKSENG